MTDLTIQQTAPARWQFICQHTQGQITYQRIGFIWRYLVQSDSYSQDFHFGTLEQATQWINQNNQPEQRSTSHA